MMLHVYNVLFFLLTENIFPNWLEEKVELSIFENIPQVSERAEVPLVPLPVAQLPPAAYPQTAQPTDEELLREFETVYDAVELTHLTPPQSPPGPATQLLLTYAQQAQCAPAPAAHWSVAAPAPAPAPSVPYDYDAASLEELIRQGAAQLGAPSPCASARSSPSCSPRSSTDEEWGAPARGKPYARGDDRRSRKKEQNKNAATRYRQKKKAEVEVLLNEETELRKRHADLGEKCSDVQREIRYIKGLMRDLFKAKGLIK